LAVEDGTVVGKIGRVAEAQVRGLWAIFLVVVGVRS